MAYLELNIGRDRGRLRLSGAAAVLRDQREVARAGVEGVARQGVRRADGPAGEGTLAGHAPPATSTLHCYSTEHRDVVTTSVSPGVRGHADAVLRPEYGRRVVDSGESDEYLYGAAGG